MKKLIDIIVRLMRSSKSSKSNKDERLFARIIIGHCEKYFVTQLQSKKRRCDESEKEDSDRDNGVCKKR